MVLFLGISQSVSLDLSGFAGFQYSSREDIIPFRCFLKGLQQPSDALLSISNQTLGLSDALLSKQLACVNQIKIEYCD
jgi:hypothetical protein